MSKIIYIVASKESKIVKIILSTVIALVKFVWSLVQIKLCRSL